MFENVFLTGALAETS